MSASLEEISNDSRSDCHVCRGGDDDEGEAFGGVHAREEGGKKNRGYRFARDITAKAKRVVLHRFRKAEKRKRGLGSLSSSSWSGSANASRYSSKTISNRVGGSGCYFCFARPPVLESSSGPMASDPNGPNFSFSMLKILIEKNDFHSKECNPHIHFDNDFHSKDCNPHIHFDREE